MKSFLEKFEISVTCDNFSAYYELAKADFAEKQNDITDFERYGIFTYMKDGIAALRDAVVQDSDNVIYCYFLYRAIISDDMAAIKALSRPKESRKDEKYDILPLFPLLYCIPEMKEAHKKMGIDPDITEATCNMFENQVQDFVDLNHRYGVSHYVTWLLHFIKCDIIRIGRFNFEKCLYKSPFEIFEKDGALRAVPKGVTFHKSGQILGSVGCEDSEGSFFADIEETEDGYIGYIVENGVCKNEKTVLKKSEWKKVLTYGDTVVSVHIPTGDKMTDEICERDISRCREVFDKAFGGYKAFYCNSWLLDPQIKTLMGRETNLTKFADRFERFPTKSGGEDVFEYVYLLPSTTLPENLPEKTSFGIAVKKHLVSGGHVYGSKGVFL